MGSLPSPEGWLVIGLSSAGVRGRGGGACPAEARGRGGGACPAEARGRGEVRGGSAEAVFFNGPEPRVVADCLTVSEVDLQRLCLPMVQRSASRRTASLL